jgi:hypothetical protein
VDHLVLSLSIDQFSLLNTAQCEDIDSSLGEAEQVLLNIEEEGAHIGLPELKGLMLEQDRVLVRVLAGQVLDDHVERVDVNGLVGHYQLLVVA